MSYTTIEIYCQDSSHDEKRWVAEEFAVVDGFASPRVWMPLSALTGKPGRRGKKYHQRINELTDTPILAGPLSLPVSVRDRYPLSCGVCGFSVTVRGERLSPILDTLADAGVSAITLCALAATLRRQA